MHFDTSKVELSSLLVRCVDAVYNHVVYTKLIVATRRPHLLFKILSRSSKKWNDLLSATNITYQFSKVITVFEPKDSKQGHFLPSSFKPNSICFLEL